MQEYHSSSPRRLVIPADLARVATARDFVEEAARAADLPKARVFDLKVAVSEAVANAIEHAASEVEVEVWPFSDRVIIEITNEGDFRPGLSKEGERRSRGLGLPLMVTLADDVHITRQPEGKTRVSLTFFLASEEVRHTTPPAEAPASVLRRLEAETLKVAAASSRAEFLADLVDHASQPFGVGSPDGSLLLFNPAYAQLLGYTKEEFATLDWGSDLTPSEWRAIEEQELEKLRDSEAPVRYEKEYLRKDGSRVPVELFVHAVKDARGVPLYYYAFITDLSDRKRVEQHLRLTQLSVDRSADLVQWVGRDGKVIYASDSSCKRFGYSHEEMLRRSVFDLDPTMTPEAWPDHWEAMKSCGSMSFESVHRSKDGESFPVEVTVSYVEMGGLEINVAVAREITERKRAEEALRESGERYRRLFESMLDGFAYCRMLYDEQGRPADFVYLAVNDRFAELTDLHNVVGRKVTEVIPGIREATPELFDIYGRVAGGGEAERFEIDFTPLDKWLNISVTSPAPDHFVAIFEDITLRKRAEEALAGSRAALQKSHDELEQRVLHRTAELSRINDELNSEMVERLKAEAAAQTERRRLLDVLETLPPMVCLLTENYRVAFANKSFRDKFGESEGRHCYEYRFGRQEPCESCESYRVLETGEPHRWEFHAVDGSVIEAHDFPFTDTDGTPMILEMDIDVTERRVAEAELARYRGHLEELVDQRTVDLEAATIKLRLEAEAREHLLEAEQQLSEELAATNEELEAQAEELQSQNEEIAAQTEELRVQNEELAEIYARENEQHRFNEAFAQISQDLASSLDPSEILERALREGARALGAERAVLETREGEGWRVTAILGFSSAARGELLSDEEASVATAMREAGAMIAVENAYNDARVSVSTVLRYGTTAVLALPVAYRGEISGSLQLVYTSGPHRFSEAELGFGESLAAAVAVAVDRAMAFQKQRALFDSLQASLLAIPERLPGLELGHLSRSATAEVQIGGDFYDVFETRGGRIGLLIGDVAGAGVEAARLATLVRDVIHAFSYRQSRPHLVLRETNRLLVGKDNPRFVTALLGFLDPKTMRFTYSSAGHPPAFLASGAGISSLEVIGPPLGVFPDSSYRQETAQLTAGSLLLLYTDGLIEARMNGDLFGEKRLADALGRMYTEPVEGIPATLLETVLGFSGGHLADDVAVLAARYAGPQRGKARPS